MIFRFAIAGLLLAALSHSALAEIGPCRPDRNETMLCGSGVGAARTIPDTISPDRKHALAWRNAKSAPDDEPEGDNELLLIRLADGIVLAKAATEYFHTGEFRRNHQHETALWSPDSRMVARVWETRYDTSGFHLWAISPDGKLAGEVNLLKLVEPAVRADMKRRVRNVENYSFSVYTAEDFTLKDDGRLGFHATMLVPKGEGEAEYFIDVKAAMVNGKLTARVLKIERLKD